MVNASKLRLTNLQQEIMGLLFLKAGSSLNQRRIAKTLGVSQPAVMKAIPKLENEELIKVEKDKESGRWSIELNRDSDRVLYLKRVDNLKQVYESGLFEFLEKELAGATIILFGSYSKGEDTINSDIDIAVIGRKEKRLNLKTYEKFLEKAIYLQFYSSLKEINKNLRENILNGIILAGSVEL